MNFIDYWDKQFIIFIHQNQWFEPQIFWYFVSQKYLWYLFVAIVFFKMKNHHWKDAFFILLVFGICILLTDRISSGIFKPLFQRLRPCHQQEVKVYLVLFEGYCGGPYGFVSSHAANIFGWSTLYILLFKPSKPERILIFFMAALIAISRVMLGVHFFTDILVGSCIGIIIGYGVFLVYKKYLRSVTSNLIT